MATYNGARYNPLYFERIWGGRKLQVLLSELG
jgi:hypothetical protein